MLRFFGLPEPELDNISPSVILTEEEIIKLKEKRLYKMLFTAFSARGEVVAFNHMIKVFSMNPKSGASCQKFPAFLNLLNDYLHIKDVCYIVADYACAPLTIKLSIETMELYFDPNVFRVTGCSYVSITWHSGVSITVNYLNLPIILNCLKEVLYSTDGYNILSNMFQHELTLCFFGNIETINITGCLSLTNVVEFPALALLTQVNFSECLNLKQIPAELPSTVLSLPDCFNGVKNPAGYMNLLKNPLKSCECDD
jgi:hypothetical protein